MDIESIESLLGLGRGAFNHIPKYCRAEAIEAIARVRQLEEDRLLRSGVYYIVLSDLSGATAASSALGVELNRRRVESFITVCVQSLGESEPKNYAQFLKAVGDAALLLFSSFSDVFAWWTETQNRMRLYSSEWNRELEPDQRTIFQLRAKTVFHVGEVEYSEGTDPVAAAVNQVFKIEKMFNSGELGCTETARAVAAPFFADFKLSPSEREEAVLPGLESPMMTWLVAADPLASMELA
jgi:class 3 adenylate cyclase